MTKYYLCNDIKFLSNMTENISPCAATHMKMSKAEIFIKNHPKYTWMKIRSSEKHNDYVICTKAKFIGENNRIVSTIRKAMSFDSIDEAYAFLDSHYNSIDPEINIVISQDFKRHPRSNSIKITKDKPIDEKYVDASCRISLPSIIRDSVYTKSSGICSICGKPLDGQYTIDHIIPLSRGGTNRSNNLRAVHEKCNKFKNGMLDDEMISNSEMVVINACINNPNSQLTDRLIRAIVRGTITKYTGG